MKSRRNNLRFSSRVNAILLATYQPDDYIHLFYFGMLIAVCS